MGPLDRVSSLKTKLSIIIVLAVAVAASTTAIGSAIDLPFFVSPAVACLLSLALVRWLAHGTTSPLRAMAAAAQAMQRGDYSQRVHTRSADEVGRLAAAFNAMAAELAQTDRIRRDLVANVSHELRTPISALQAMLENLVDEVVEPTPELLRSMHQQIERLGRLVRDLLDLSRLESGAAPLDRKTIVLRKLVDDAAAECRLHHELDVRVEVPDELTLIGDEARLHQVFANLLDNAARHAGADRQVIVTARAAGERARVEVVDHGPGIPAGERDRVFDRFYRTDRARSTDLGGSGLGLAIARGIVELHDGSIRATAAEPRGCRIVIELPRPDAL